MSAMPDNTPIVTAEGEETALAAPAAMGAGMAFADPAALDQLEEAAVGINIKPAYYEFKAAGETIRAIYSGMGTITKKIEDQKTGDVTYQKMPAVVLQSRAGMLLNAGASLVSQFENLPIGTPVQITYTGEEKTASGRKVKAYQVRMLMVKIPVTVAAATPLRSMGPADPDAGPSMSDPRPAKPEFFHKEFSTKYWEKVRALHMTDDEGAAHLELHHRDLQAAFNALDDPAD